MIETLIYVIYCLIAAAIALVLVKEIIKTPSAQEAILFSIILVPFVLRVLQLK